MPHCSPAHLEMVVAALPGGSGGTSPPGSALARDKDWCPLLNCLVSSRLCTQILSEASFMQVAGRWPASVCPVVRHGAQGSVESALCALSRVPTTLQKPTAWKVQDLSASQLPRGASHV